MTNNNEKQMLQTGCTNETGARKPYETPELTVHGRVEELTQYLPLSCHGSKC